MTRDFDRNQAAALIGFVASAVGWPASHREDRPGTLTLVMNQAQRPQMDADTAEKVRRIVLEAWQKATDDMVRTAVTKRFAALLAACNLELEDVADISGVRIQTLRRWIKGQTVPNLPQARRAYNVLIGLEPGAPINWKPHH